MLRPAKDQQVSHFADILGRSAGVVFVDYTGMTVAESDGLRRSLRDGGVRFQVVKNSLLARALAAAEREAAVALLKGSPTGLLWGEDDPVAVARAACAFGETCEHLKVKGGVVDGQALSAPEATALSKMAGRKETQAQVVALARGPEGRLLGQVSAPGGRLAGAVAALVERLEKASAA